MNSGGSTGGGYTGPPAGNAKPDSGTKFDFSGPDILQQNYAPVTQAELDLPQTWNESCDSCNEYQFCDRDHCAYLGQGGIAYAGGMYGRSCPDSPNDPQLVLDPRSSNICGVDLCINGLCRSCRTDEECCLYLGSLDADCLTTIGMQGGGVVCLWWDRIQSNACFSATSLASIGIDLAPLTP